MINDSFITCRPSARLQPYIAYYYFHHTTNHEFRSSFIYYPHYKNALTVYQDADFQVLNEFTTRVTPGKERELTLIYSKMYKHAGKVHLEGKFSKIGIAFQPLGIQHFMEGDYESLYPKEINLIAPLCNNLKQVLNQVFEVSDFNEKFSLLNRYFQNKWIGFKEQRIIIAVDQILYSKGLISVHELSTSLQINRKTLLRLFRKHLDCSVEEYRKLIRFRFALEKIQQGKPINLTQVSADYYYDQSDFIKQFKKLTALPPKKLTAVLTNPGNEDTYWNFIK